MSHARTLLTLDSKPYLPPYVRLKPDPIRHRVAFLAPERVLWPDTIALEILILCDGVHTIAGIARELAQRYAAPADTITGDIIEFLQSWTDQRFLKV